MRRSALKKARTPSAKGIEGGRTRKPRSRWLSYDAGILTYKGKHHTQDIHLSQWYLPPAAGQKNVTALSDHPSYIESLLSFLDEFIDATDSKQPEPKEIRKQCSFFLRVVDWLRAHSVYKLADASREDMEQLARDVAYKGWINALNYKQRWSTALKLLSANQIENGLYFATKKKVLSGLRAPFWSKILGWGPDHYLPPQAKRHIQKHFGEGDEVWRSRKDVGSVVPTETTLRSILSDLNRLSHLSVDVDRLAFRPFNTPAATAHKLAQEQSKATENLALEDAVQLLEQTIFVLYEVAPKLQIILDQFQVSRDQMGKKKLPELIFNLPSANELGRIFGKPLLRFSEMGKRSPLTSEEQEPLTIDTVIGMVQSACAVAIGGMTAHRPDEIAGPHNGLRVGDLVLEAGTDSLAQLNIHFGKSFKERRQVYVSRFVIDAVQCLENIKRLSLPNRSMKLQDGDSLFRSHRPARDRIGALVSFSMVPQLNASRSSSNFLIFCFRDRESVPKFEPRMLRRFHVQLYMRRHKHPRIKVAQHILGHLWSTTTNGYAFDKPNVAPGHRGENRIGARNAKRSKDALEMKSLREALNIAPDFDVVTREILEENITSIISKEGAAGGFARFIRKLYSNLLGNIHFAAMEESEQAAEIADTVFKKGYRIEPMMHGECLANHDGRLIERGVCHKDGELQRENAGPMTCRKCPFHYLDGDYISNLEELLVELNSDANDFLLPPIQQHRARVDADNLVRIIQLNRETMAENQKAISLIKEGRA